MCILFCVAACVGCSSSAPPGNVVMITMDTVRADHIGAYGYNRAMTPTLDAFAAEGAVFETAISVAPVTAPTHASIFTGLYPPQHGVRNNGTFRLGDGQLTLAERFAAEGYDTAAVVSAAVLDSKYGLDQGFRVYDDSLQGSTPQKLYMFKEVTADRTTERVKAVLETLEEPFFLWVHYFDAHADYEPPPPYDVIFHDSLYDGEIAFVDRELGNLQHMVERQFGPTTWVLTADHGESLGDHGERTHGIFLYRSTTHVPLIIAGPTVQPGRYPGVVSQVDLAPTLAESFGLSAAKTDGVSLHRTLTRGQQVPVREGVYLESLNPRLHFGWHELRAVDSGRYKYVDAPTEELYDVSADPHEAHNLLPGASHDLKRPLQNWIGEERWEDIQPLPVDLQTQHMLDALGYLSPGVESEDTPDPKAVVHRWTALQACQQLIRDDRTVDAERCLRALIEEDSRNWTALLSLASVLQATGRGREALATLERASHLDPDNDKIGLAKAKALGLLGQKKEAIELVKAVTLRSPLDPVPWSQLGDLYGGLGEVESALDAFGQALRVDPHLVDAYIGVANTLHRNGQSERALVYVRRAVELDSSHVTAWYNLGVILDALGRPDDAVEAYRQALSIEPKHSQTLNNFGSLRRRQNQLVAAENLLLRALQFEPDNVEAMFNLAGLYCQKSDRKGIGLLQKVRLLRPSLLAAEYSLATCEAQLGQVDDAVSRLRQLEAQVPSPVVPLVEAAKIQLANGRRSAAGESLRRALQMGGPELQIRLAQDPQFQGLLGDLPPANHE